MPLDPDPDPESEPTPEDLGFYYGLNRRSAQKQDAPFSHFGLSGLTVVLLLVLLLGVVSIF